MIDLNECQIPEKGGHDYIEELDCDGKPKSVESNPDEVSKDCDVSLKGEMDEANYDSIPTDCNDSVKSERVEDDTGDEDVDEDKFNCDIIRDELAKLLEVGSVIETLDQAYILYCEYARLMGFSIKKGQQSYLRQSEKVKMKLYLCSCNGVAEHTASLSKVAEYKKQMWRTNCKARLRVSRRKDGPWTVSCFHKNHNHEMLAPDQTYLLCSARHLSHAKLSVLATLNSAGIRVSKAFRFMEKESGGLRNIGFIRKDAYNNIGRDRRESRIANLDAQRVIQFLDKRGSEDPLFRWSTQLDDEGRLMNFFYRDTRCALDYSIFGDVLSIDTTHKTNKYNLLCAPFVGMNHHRQNIIFGLGFLSDETTKSFEWLFSTFLSHMEMKEPQIVFSDESQALVNAIDYTFQTAKHRLCQWHVNRNATGHFGPLNADEEFKRNWHRLMNLCETEDEFEETWRNIIETYNLAGHSWFKKMYNIKRRWASVFSNDRFSAGLHSTSWSESTNKMLKGLCSGCTCLYDFVIQYEQALKDSRDRERAEDARCMGVPGHVVLNNPLLNHAADVYTRNAFGIFHKAFTEASNVYMAEHPADYRSDDLVFHVRCNGMRKGRIVTVQRSTQKLECSCRKFVTDGIFCNHIINIMLLLNVRRLPEQYIVKRWTKTARMEIDCAPLTTQCGNDTWVLRKMVFVNHFMREAYDIAQTCNDEAHMINLHKEMRSLRNVNYSGQLDNQTTPVKSKAGEAIKVNGRVVRNPQIRKARCSPKNKENKTCSPKQKAKPASKAKGKGKTNAGPSACNMVQGKDDDVTNPKEQTEGRKKRISYESCTLKSVEDEEPVESTKQLGLDFITSQGLGFKVSSLPVNRS